MKPDVIADKIVNTFLGILFAIAIWGGIAVAFHPAFLVLVALSIILGLDRLMAQVNQLVDMAENNLRGFLVEQAHDQPPID